MPLLFAMGYLFHQQWIQARCAYLTFETTRTALSGPWRGTFATAKEGTVIVRDFPDRVEGTGSCGRFAEKVELPKLESVAW
jgi:hypothetical protein